MRIKKGLNIIDSESQEVSEIKKGEITTNISKITPNINGINSPIKR
jgi:hypothetical protein